jgi:hypothetical protein
MKPHALTVEQEQEISRRIEIRRAYSDRNLMAEFGCSRSVLYRIANDGPRETKQKVSIESLYEELQRGEAS